MDQSTARLLYTHYEKPMASQFAMMKASAIPENTKMQSLSNDVIRQMKNVSELVGQEERNLVVDRYGAKLIRSGYRSDVVKKVITSGLQGYERIRKMEKEGKTRIHRSAKQSLPGRYRKKLLVKSTWFLKKKQENEKESNTTTTTRMPARPRRSLPEKDKSSKKENMTTATVLFVPGTRNGKLAAKLREAEEELSKICGNKVKIIERAGSSVKSILVKPNPWQDQSCGRGKCIACMQDKGKGQCKTRSITYQTWCQECQLKGVDSVYIGESARSYFERGLEHQQDYSAKKEESHMHEHAVEMHAHEAPPTFGMKVLQKHRTPLYRQLHEAVLIARSRSVLLNAKSEYNRCLLPTLSVEYGNKTSSDKGQESSREEMEEDLQDVAKRKANPVCIPRRRKRRRIEMAEGEKSSCETSKTGKRKYNEFASFATISLRKKKREIQREIAKLREIEGNF